MLELEFQRQLWICIRIRQVHKHIVISKQDGAQEMEETWIFVNPKEKSYSVKFEMETSTTG